MHLPYKVKLFLDSEDILAGPHSFIELFQGYREVLTLTWIKIIII